MSGPPREPRIARQQHDDGAPDTTVHVGCGEGGRDKMYHEDEQCRRLSRQFKKDMTRKAAQRRWFAPCGFYVIDEETNE